MTMTVVAFSIIALYFDASIIPQTLNMQITNKIFILVVTFFVFSIAAKAQTSSKSQKIRQLLEVTGSGKLGVQVAQNLINQYRKSYDNVDSQFWDGLTKKLNPDELISLIVPIYDKHFSEEDIDQIIAFYKTPVGIKLISSMSTIMQESMQVGEKWGQKISEQVLEEMKEKGYIKG